MSPDAALLERWIWLIGSFGLALIAIAARWFLERAGGFAGGKGRHPEGGAVPPTEAPASSPLLSPGIIHPLRLLYAVGVPAAALLWRGVLTPRGLGLQAWPRPNTAVTWEDWAGDIGWALAIAGLLWLLLRLGDAIAARHETALAPRHRLGAALREAIYHQAHWAFYREPFVLLWGIEMGAWAGLLPVMAEALINPARWEDLQTPRAGRDLLVRAGLGVASVMLYIQTQNLWLMLAADALVMWALGESNPE